MKTRHLTTTTAGVIGICSLTLCFEVKAAQTIQSEPAKVSANEPALNSAASNAGDQRNVSPNVSNPAATLENNSGVPQANRASKIVGIKVKNQQNEDLGQIEDVVINLDSGRVSYAVMSVGGALGIGQKNLAIPMSAFNSSQDGTYLVLNADKQRLQQAPSLERGNWPDVGNPAWGGEAYWGAPNRSSTPDYWSPSVNNRREPYQNYDPRDRYDRSGDYGRFEQDRRFEVYREREPRYGYYGYGPDRRDPEYYPEYRDYPQNRPVYRYNEFEYRGSSRGDYDTGYEGGASVRRSTNREQYNEDRSLNSERRVFQGEVIAINPDNRVITVADEGRTMRFMLDDRPVLTLRGNRNPRLVDFRVGYHVRVGYRRTGDGYNIAESIIRTSAEESR